MTRKRSNPKGMGNWNSLYCLVNVGRPDFFLRIFEDLLCFNSFCQLFCTQYVLLLIVNRNAQMFPFQFAVSVSSWDFNLPSHIEISIYRHMIGISIYRLMLRFQFTVSQLRFQFTVSWFFNLLSHSWDFNLPSHSSDSIEIQPVRR